MTPSGNPIVPRDFSVVIVTYNSSAWIRPCLDSVLRQAGECSRLEIIVVDNASTDETRAIVATEYPLVTVIANDRNRGFGAAVNQGAARAQHDVLLFLNPDTVVEAGFMRGLHEFFALHPGPSIAGGRLKEPDGRVQPSCWRTPGLWSVLVESALPYTISLEIMTVIPSEVSLVETVSGACMAVAKADFDRLGGFDERFFMYYEDFDLCIRARQAGIPVYHVPGAPVVHHVRKSTEQSGEQFFLYVYRSKLEIVRKHESPAAHLLASLIVLAGISVRIPLYALAGKLLQKEELLRLSKYHTFVLPRLASELFSRQSA
jgi:GT2 family glycosyltransferase